MITPGMMCYIRDRDRNVHYTVESLIHSHYSFIQDLTYDEAYQAMRRWERDQPSSSEVDDSNGDREMPRRKRNGAAIKRAGGTADNAVQPSRKFVVIDDGSGHQSRVSPVASSPGAFYDDEDAIDDVTKIPPLKPIILTDDHQENGAIPGSQGTV